MHIHTFIRTHIPQCILRHMHTHKGTLRDTSPHTQALPAARIVNTMGLCSDLRLQLSASLSRLSSSQVRSCPTPASCLALAHSGDSVPPPSLHLPTGPRPGPRLQDGNCPILPGADSARFYTQKWRQASRACCSPLGTSWRRWQDGARIL